MVTKHGKVWLWDEGEREKTCEKSHSYNRISGASKQSCSEQRLKAVMIAKNMKAIGAGLTKD